MRIKARIKKLEGQVNTKELTVVVEKESVIHRYESMDDDSFLKETGIDRKAYNLVIYVIDKYEEKERGKNEFKK